MCLCRPKQPTKHTQLYVQTYDATLVLLFVHNNEFEFKKVFLAGGGGGGVTFYKLELLNTSVVDGYVRLKRRRQIDIHQRFNV